MAPVMSAKRARALTNGVDSSGGGMSGKSRVGSFAPNPTRRLANTTQNKRPRRSEPGSSDESSDDNRSNPASDSDESGQEDEHQRTEQEAWATQQVQKERLATANKQNVATDCGIIEEIQCINFMCHEHLTVTLGPLINFIIGHNGSGKSAVLTALTICLGGKATATNRAQNLKSLIKEGKDHCSVTVKIKNQGPLAYKKAQYGDSIIVERHFSRSGSSGFKLKDLNGKVVTTKKAELEDILDAFSMQIDNPMNVLTQDMARQFLNHSTPKEKYNFFLKGTQLENLNRDYQQMEQSLEEMNAKAEVKEADLGVLRHQMEELEKKARRAQKLEQMRAKEVVLANQAAWAHVQEREAELQKAIAGLAKVDTAILEREKAVEEVSELYERADQAHEAAKQTITDLATEMEPVNQELVEAKAKFDEVKVQLQQLLSDARKAAGEVQAKQAEVKKMETEIEQHRQRQAEAENGLYAEKLRELDEAKVELDAAKETFESHGSGLPQLREHLKEAHEKQAAATKKVDKTRGDEQRIRSNISTLRGGQSNWIDGYQQPRKLQDLLGAISRTNFREKPVGPLGKHINLLSSKWGYILEKQFGQNLNAFVVTSKQDQTTLSGMMTRIGWYVSRLYA
jgi:chromosome segregation ATPase